MTQRYSVRPDRLKRLYHVVGQKRVKAQGRVKKVDVYERVHLFKFKGKSVDFKRVSREQTLYEKSEYGRGRLNYQRPLAETKIKTYHFPCPGDGYTIMYPEAMAVANADLASFLQSIVMQLKRRNPDSDFFRFEGYGYTNNPDLPTFVVGGYMNHDPGDAVETFLTNLDDFCFMAPSGKDGALLKEIKASVWIPARVIAEPMYENLYSYRD